jgi:hypothetical protein
MAIGRPIPVLTLNNENARRLNAGRVGPRRLRHWRSALDPFWHARAAIRIRRSPANCDRPSRPSASGAVDFFRRGSTGCSMNRVLGAPRRITDGAVEDDLTLDNQALKEQVVMIDKFVATSSDL